MKKVTIDSKLFKALLIIIATNSLFLSDIYLPSLPAIREYFGVENYIIQLSITYFMLGLATSAFIWGPLSDSFGRRKIMFIGFGISLTATYLCLNSSSAEHLAYFRFFQGVGLGAARVISRAISRDCFKGKKLAKLSSLIAMWAAIFVTVGPVLGGYIQVIFDWHGSFIFMMGYQVVIVSIFFLLLPETNESIGQKPFRPIEIAIDYFKLLTDRVFLGYVICGAAAMGAMVAYVTASPFLFQDLCGLTPVQFGWLSIPICLATVLGGSLNTILLDRVGLKKLIIFGASLIFASGILMLVFAKMGFTNMYSILLPTLLMLVGFPIVTANAYAGSSYSYPNIAGMVGAFYAALQVLGGSVTSAVIAFATEKSQLPVSLVLFTMGLIIFIAIYGLVMPIERRRKLISKPI